MKFGVCTDPGSALNPALAGYDYIECAVGALLKPAEPEAAFDAALHLIGAAGIPCPVVNCFSPGSLPICGPKANRDALEKYVELAFQRAGRAGYLERFERHCRIPFHRHGG